MSQIWVPPDIAEICPEQIAPLTQCSQLGFMYLTLITQLFGKSIDSVNKNPYFDQSSEVQSGFLGSQAGVVPRQHFSAQSAPHSQFSEQFQSFGDSRNHQGLFGPDLSGFLSEPFGGHLPAGFHGSTQPGFQSQELPKEPSVYRGPLSYTSSIAHPFGETQASFGHYKTHIQSGPVPIKSHSLQFASGLSPVSQTTFSINHDEKTHSHSPKVNPFPDASFYSKQEFGKPDQSRLQKEYQRPSDFKYESSFGKYEDRPPVFNFEEISRSFQDIDAAATGSKVAVDKIPGADGKKKRKKNRQKRQVVEEYDFIVVGAGSAGCVVANRLSEVKHWKVLLLEAGPEEPDVTSVPGLAPVLASSSIDWNYRTQPEELTCRAQRGQTCAWYSGRVMGGSSAINYLVYMRGNKRDYDDWAHLGNHGWSYGEVLPYFKKSENNRDIEEQDTKYHGVGGPMDVERFKYSDLNALMLAEAFHEKGLPLVDFNGETQIGTMLTQTTSKNGKRMSTNTAFITPIRYMRKNLKVLPNALVTQILIDNRNKTAYGVTFLRNGVWYKVHAKKEIVICAGAIGSPKLLMLSGIGPKKNLKDLKIPVIKDLNVGRNLQDHATTNAMLISLSNVTSTSIQANQILNELKMYFNSRRIDDPLSATGPLHVSAFIRTKFADEDKTVPDIQFHFDGRNSKEFYADSTTYLETNIMPLPYYDSINVRPILLAPISRGYLILNRTNPIFGRPMIYPRFFTKGRDLDILVEALKFVVKLEDTKIFKENQAKFIRKPVEACKHYEWGTNQYFACLFTRYTTTIFHPSGTCKMGPPRDKGAVVNLRLKVYGVKRLRVADASVMPNIVRGNTNAAVIMIGEKISDIIKEDWNLKS